MDTPWNRAWLLVAGLVALGLSVARGADYTTQDSRTAANPGVIFFRYAGFKAATGTMQIFVSSNGGDYFGLGINTSTWNETGVNTVRGNLAWSDFNQQVAPKTYTSTAASYSINWKLTLNGPVVGNATVDIPEQEVEVQWSASDASTQQITLPRLEITVGPDGAPLINDPLEDPEYKKGILLLDNMTGEGQDLPFGDEQLHLEPGYNSFPFYGEVGADGFPLAAGDDWVLEEYTGPDGQTYWIGRVVNGPEGETAWSGAPQGVEIFPPTSGTTGPVIKLPNGMTPTNSDYVTLPPGMRPGNNVPLPGGMTPGSPGLPAGVTPGSNGALPSGVISGGTTYLPPGVSAGTTSGNNQGTGGTATGGNTGGGGVTVTPSEDAEPYLPGPDMSGLEAQGRTAGRQAAEKVGGQITEAAGQLGEKARGFFGEEGGPVFWTAPSASIFGGSDASWLTLSLPIGAQQVTITVPNEWITLIRAILLWGVKIWFVIACIKLMLR